MRTKAALPPNDLHQHEAALQLFQCKPGLAQAPTNVIWTLPPSSKRKAWPAKPDAVHKMMSIRTVLRTLSEVVDGHDEKRLNSAVIHDGKSVPDIFGIVSREMRVCRQNMC